MNLDILRFPVERAQKHMRKIRGAEEGDCRLGER